MRFASLLVLLGFAFLMGCSYSAHNQKQPPIVMLQHGNDLAGILKKKPLVLVVFGKKDCEDCGKERPVLGRLALEYDKRLTVVGVMQDAAPELHSAYFVKGTPDMRLFKNGKPAGANWVGFTPYETMQPAIEKNRKK
jgi:thioredoxin-like negative regulator of GroEL